MVKGTDRGELERVVGLVVCDNPSTPGLVVGLPNGKRDSRETPARGVVIEDAEGTVRHARRCAPSGVDTVRDARIRRGINIPIRVEGRFGSRRDDEIAVEIVRRAYGLECDEASSSADVEKCSARGRAGKGLKGYSCRDSITLPVRGISVSLDVSLLSRSESHPVVFLGRRPGACGRVFSAESRCRDAS